MTGIVGEVDDRLSSESTSGISLRPWSAFTTFTNQGITFPINQNEL